MYVVIPTEKVVLQFACSHCGEHSATCSPSDLNLCGTPQCPDCDADMDMAEDATVEVNL